MSLFDLFFGDLDLFAFDVVELLGETVERVVAVLANVVEDLPDRLGHFLVDLE